MDCILRLQGTQGQVCDKKRKYDKTYGNRKNFDDVTSLNRQMITLLDLRVSHCFHNIFKNISEICCLEFPPTIKNVLQQAFSRLIWLKFSVLTSDRFWLN